MGRLLQTCLQPEMAGLDSLCGSVSKLNIHTNPLDNFVSMWILTGYVGLGGVQSFLWCWFNSILRAML